jgi:hypothetical protein
MVVIVGVRAGIAGIAQLHLQRGVNGGIRLKGSAAQYYSTDTDCTYD